MQAPEHVDVDHLTRRHVAHQLETQHVERDALRGQHPFGAFRGFALTQHQRPNAVRIAEGQQSMADDHGDDGVAPAAAPIDRAHGRKDIRRGDPRRAHALQLGSQHVEQDLGIGSGVEMTAVFALEDFRELTRIGQIAVVSEADAIRSIDVERLGFGGAVTTGRRITDVAHAHVAPKILHGVLIEDVAHQPLPLAHEELAIGHRGDACGVLPTVLQHRQRIVDAMVDATGPDDSCDTAHAVSPWDQVEVEGFEDGSLRFFSSRSRFSPTIPRKASATPTA
jgi:hypothetical protein